MVTGYRVREHLKEILQEKGQSDLPKIKARFPRSLHIELSKFYQVCSFNWKKCNIK